MAVSPSQIQLSLTVRVTAERSTRFGCVIHQQQQSCRQHNREAQDLHPTFVTHRLTPFQRGVANRLLCNSVLVPNLTGPAVICQDPPFLSMDLLEFIKGNGFIVFMVDLTNWKRSGIMK